MTLTLNQADELARKGVGFYCAHPDPGGRRTVHLTAKELVQYAANPVKFLAAHYRVTEAEYLGWHRDNFNVICAAKTKSGRQCRQTVTGFSLVYEPAVWAAQQGAYCAVHQEGRPCA